MSKKEEMTQAAADLVLRELNAIEARDVFGGLRHADGDGDGGGWVKVGPIEPIPA